MKRFLIFIGLISFLGINYASAESIDETVYCSVPEGYNTGSKASKILSNITGMNFSSTKIAELAIQKAIKAQLGSKTNVEIYPYTVTGLLQGKFKSMTINSKSINLGGLYASEFSAGTECEYNQVAVKDNSLVFKENFVMKFSGKISEEDLKKTMGTRQFAEMVNNAKISVFGQTVFQLRELTLGLENNKIKLTAGIQSPLWGYDEKYVRATSGLRVEGGKIKYDNINVNNSASTGKAVQAMLSLINLANPFTFNIKLSDNTSGTTSVKNVIIDNNTISMNGFLYIPKN